MSRRAPNPAAERAARNQATIKSLLKTEANKICADCKRNKHPRWASWNLGVFVCIRCSGIHRGMGTHISRVKSVDLDAWTDEQLKSILSWGNARANKYWEAKLAPGHVPSESKMENFIRTKYELKRWVMDGPMPDPASLDVEGDDEIPLSVVKEKHNVERRESLRKASAGNSSGPKRPAARAPVGDLLGGDDDVPSRGSGSTPPMSRPPPKAAATKDSLLGLDFLGGGTEPAPPPRPSSTTAAQSRPDLKNSILSLYATAPRPQAASPQPAGSFGGMTSPGAPPQPQNATSGIQDAFSSLSFGGSSSMSSAPKAPPAPDPFASFGSSKPAAQPQASASAFGGLGGGSFFDTTPAVPAVTSHQKKASSSGFDPFASFSAPTASKPTAPATSSSSAGGLFDLSAPAPAPAAPPAPSSAAQPSSMSSAFNLTAAAAPKAAPAPAATTAGGFGGANMSGDDVWGGNAWGAPATAEPPKPAAPAPVSSTKPAISNDFSGSWGAGGGFANTPIVPGASGFAPTAAPKVAQDEEFGGWASSTGGASTTASKPAGGLPAAGNSEDLFSNVWQ